MHRIYCLLYLIFLGVLKNDHFFGFVYSDPPSISEGRDVGMTLGQWGVLLCEADAVPQADIEWYRDDRRYDITLGNSDTSVYIFGMKGEYEIL